ncbi:hypothetical protein OpiT1DRAFT_00924 [Opitutaceae bacterium TAV1]|nr:hypothetical protein OpiT1DRAFT_00924 [Opitutaceae bacterium TAV1]
MTAIRPKSLRRVVLEMTPKPFTATDDATLTRVCETLFDQWLPLLRHADEAAVLLWTADGSEILDYQGIGDDGAGLVREIEWARYIGVANPPDEYPEDPKRQSIAAWPRPYRENPARITYGDLRRIVARLHEVGSARCGLPVSVGAIFDPGPEFAKSPFKYTRHPEIAPGGTMGKGTWVTCGATLNGDSEPYAGFPDGIPDGTPLGVFLGRQARLFLRDMGFDYLWFSNGFGFALDAWHVTGALFDGAAFHPQNAAEIRERILGFWRDFRSECPGVRIETRGSNFSTGMDLASDASPVRDIYRGGFDLVAPPNSPWAAMDGDYGLELVGYLSHIAELPPGDHIPWRYYLHDPWFLNSPWLDRYGRSPHDIYLPLALARLDAAGRVTPVGSASFLTVDNSHGELVRQCPREVIPHVLTALADRPDAAGPVTWVYPFDDYNERAFSTDAASSSASGLAEVFFGDWFMRSAVNHGFPLGGVISSENFLAARKNSSVTDALADTILALPVSAAGSALEGALADWVERGGRALLYGPVTAAGERLLALLNLRLVTPLEGEFELASNLSPDVVIHEDGAESPRLLHRAILSGGGLDTQPRTSKTESDDWEELVSVAQANERRTYAVIRKTAAGGQLAWLRGTFSAKITDAKLPVAHDPSKWLGAEVLLRRVLGRLGISIRMEKQTPDTRTPVFVAAASRGALFFSGYNHSTLARLSLRFLDGAPLLLGCDAWLENGHATYNLPKAWHHECRCFVEQAEPGAVVCQEQCSGEVGIRRRMLIKGLRNATICFCPEPDTDLGRLRMTANDPWPYVAATLPFESEQTAGGLRLRIRGITGSLLISW